MTWFPGIASKPSGQACYVISDHGVCSANLLILLTYISIYGLGVALGVAKGGKMAWICLARSAITSMRADGQESWPNDFRRAATRRNVSQLFIGQLVHARKTIRELSGLK